MKGSDHFLLQRLTAIALLPLVPWFCIVLANLAGADHATVTGWLRTPLHAVASLAMLLIGLYHGHLGMRVVIEDYVSPGRWQRGLLEALWLVSWTAGSLALYFWFRVLLGSAP